MYVIVDTNVPTVANGKSNQATPLCVINCIAKLREIQQGQKIVVLDEGWLVIREYQKNLSPKGQPGVGDAFLKWILTNQANPKCCQLIKITEISEYNFAEFPDDSALENFDLSDRKWVALAVTHPDKPPILNAVDSDWRDFKAQLAVHGVRVEFLCPDVIC